MSNLLKRLALTALLFSLIAGLQVSPFSTETAQAAFSYPIVADHRHTDIAHIPASYIGFAKQQFRVWYGHTSHGSQISNGMEILMAQNSLYSFNSGAGSLSYVEPSPVGDLGSPDWITHTRNQLSRSDNDRNVVMWSWCGQLSTATEADVNFYLTEMNRLEADYPNVHFIYMTGHLDGTGPAGNLYARNNQIRQYALSHNKILYDFADIESYDPNGAYYPNETDACAWCQTWCTAHSCPVCTHDCAHSHCFNCYQKGKAFWALLATMAGWPGPGAQNPPGQPTLIAPSGTIYASSPAYTWNAIQDASTYRLYVEGAGGMVIDQTLQAASVCPNATCTATPGTALANGDYQWWVQASNAGGNGPWSTAMGFAVRVGAPTTPPMLIVPTGTIGAPRPTYSWHPAPNATWYQVQVSRASSENVFAEWFDASSVCTGDPCAVTPDHALSNGDYRWTVRPWNDVAYGPWSGELAFSVNVPQLGAATLIFPQGAIDIDAPTYTWNAVSGATWYQLWVNGPSGNVVKQWTEAAVACIGATCTLSPAKTLPSGAYQWWVRTYNETQGNGPWSTGMAFDVPKPGQPQLIAPNGTFDASTPAFSWYAASHATWYYLWVDGPKGNVIKKWYTAGDALCAGGGTCTISPGKTLANGAYRWWVQSWGVGGNGPWSARMDFNIAIPIPGAATLIAPNGSGAPGQPTFTWNAIPYATWYYLWVDDPYRFRQWYTAENAGCAGSATCAITPTLTLPPGAHRWWVQTWGPGGYGPWSAEMPFTVGP